MSAQVCRECGCTEESPCRLEIFEFVPCWWSLPGLCSSCLGIVYLMIYGGTATGLLKEAELCDL